jgi:bifunctional enzyme CysN/CysC
MHLRNGRRLIIADAPGHEQYTRNMAVAASRADIGLVLVDATRGIRPQTLRHLHICSLMKVSRIAVVVNKLDGVDYSQDVFETIKSDLQPAIARLGLPDVQFIPVSALSGDNVSTAGDNMPWNSGPTLLDYLQDWPEQAITENAPHLGVQTISRAENFRGVAGTVFGGSFALNDEVVVLPSKKRARISRISTFDGDLTTAPDLSAVTLVLEPDVDASRGDAIELASNFVEPANRFAAEIVWLGDSEMIHSRSYFLINGSTVVPAMVTAIRHVININNGDHESARTLKTNEIAAIEFATDVPIALNSYSKNRYSGNFILVDRTTMSTVGAGMVTHQLRRSANITEHHFEIDRETRAKQKSQTPQVIWLTGLSGSGKSTIANALEKRLFANGVHSYVLDGDNLRLGINKDLGFTKEDRAENVRRVSEIAKLMFDAGLVVVVALVSPYKVDRDHARELFAEGDFAEVWIETPAEICAQRDPKGLYKKAAAGELPNLTGVGQDYEPPTAAELVLDGQAPLEESVEKLLKRFF